MYHILGIILEFIQHSGVQKKKLQCEPNERVRLNEWANSRILTVFREFPHSFNRILISQTICMTAKVF